MKHRVVVGHQRRWPLYLFITGLALSSIAGWYVAYAALSTSGLPLQAWLPGDSLETRLRRQNLELQEALRATQSESNGENGSPIFHKQACEIDQQACDAVRESVSALNAESAQLREQLNFYRNVAAPGQAQAGVRIVSLELLPEAVEGVWRYELLLLQPARRNRDASGEYAIDLMGRNGKSVETLTISDAFSPSSGKAQFSFRTFGTLEGQIKLPADFKPLRVQIRLEVDQGEGPRLRLSEIFDWSMLVAAGKK